MTNLRRSATVASLVVAAALSTAGHADASPQDAAFLDRLDKVGITSSDPYTTILDAHAVCRQLNIGTSQSRIVDFVLSDNPDLDWDSAADYVVLANMTYCPPS